MKERHKRKEIFSFILVSNMDNRSRQFSISALRLRVLLGILFLLLVGIGVVFYLFFERGYDKYQAEKKIKEKEAEIVKLKEEMELMVSAEESLRGEIDRLNHRIEELEQPQETPEEEKKNIVPKLYPLEQAGDLKGTFTEEEPYLTINVQKGNKVIATGDGIVTLVDYDEAYVHSIEIEHADGYISRYLCNKDAKVEVSEGEEVKARDPLYEITSSGTSLHYQIMVNNEPINPFQVMKGEE